MRCPFCGSLEDRVVDSREGEGGKVIRRRRKCLKCKRRFTTYEEVEENRLMVIKRDGRREPFKREKLKIGILKSCEKRPIKSERIERIIDEICGRLRGNYEKEVPSEEIGKLVIKRLRRLDEIAYVRFASVYRQFKDVDEFTAEIKRIRRKNG